MTKLRYQVAGLVMGALFVSAVLVVGQNLTGDAAAGNGPANGQPTAPPAPRPQFFTGTMVELDANHIKVTRTLVGRPTESRSFAINAATKMNKTAIKVHSRVTVRYKRLPEGDLALEIQPTPVIVRTPKV
jgi:hypothetical protein